MMAGRIPNLARRLYITWSVFWLRQQQGQRRKAIAEARQRWQAIPAYIDELNHDINAIECEIADLEQELI